ncbi:MAG: hypothetical protein IT371_30680 [Deltaproteobacteria bacterium]|nr:hypothetical protein [Deltaproteobacteria bacterium]
MATIVPLGVDSVTGQTKLAGAGDTLGGGGAPLLLRANSGASVGPRPRLNVVGDVGGVLTSTSDSVPNNEVVLALATPAVVVQTTSVVIGATDNGKTFVTTGAGASPVTFTLPSPTNGFRVRIYSDHVGGSSAVAVSGATIRLGGYVTPANGTLASSLGVGSFVELVADGTNWKATSYTGVWTVIQAGVLGIRVFDSDPSLFVFRNVDFNSTADQPLYLNASRFIVRRVVAANATVSLTTAAGGIYTGAGKTGTAIVPAAQTYAALTASNKFLDLTLDASTGTDVFTLPAGTPWYFSLTTPQGVAATGDVYIWGDATP